MKLDLSMPRTAWRGIALAGASLASSPAGLACATCFGRSDSALAQGMNMGILFLLGVVLSVLAALAGFIVFLARRAAAVRPPPETQAPLRT